MLTTLLPLTAASSAPSLAGSNAYTDTNSDHALVTSITQPLESLTMKATSSITQRPSRNPHYSKAKRSSMASSHGSPNGVGKSRSSSSLHTVHRRTPSNPSSLDVLKRQRTMQLNALSRDIKKLLEEEYREEVMEYMLDMEVCRLCFSSFYSAKFSHRNAQCPRLPPWICSLNCNGTCALAWSIFSSRSISSSASDLRRSTSR